MCPKAPGRAERERSSALRRGAGVFYGTFRSSAHAAASICRDKPRNTRPLYANAFRAAGILRCGRAVQMIVVVGLVLLSEFLLAGIIRDVAKVPFHASGSDNDERYCDGRFLQACRKWGMSQVEATHQRAAEGVEDGT